MPQRRKSCGFADAVLALVLNLNFRLLAKLCVCIPFLPGKRAAILILEIPAERDDTALFAPSEDRPIRDRLVIGPHTTSIFLLLRLCLHACFSCPRTLTGETLRRLLWEKRAGRTASGNAGCAIGTARNDSCGVLLSLPPDR